MMGGFGKGGVEGGNHDKNHDRDHDRNLSTTSDKAEAK